MDRIPIYLPPRLSRVLFLAGTDRGRQKYDRRLGCRLPCTIVFRDPTLAVTTSANPIAKMVPSGGPTSCRLPVWVVNLSCFRIYGMIDERKPRGWYEPRCEIGLRLCTTLHDSTRLAESRIITTPKLELHPRQLWTSYVAFYACIADLVHGRRKMQKMVASPSCQNLRTHPLAAIQAAILPWWYSWFNDHWFLNQLGLFVILSGVTKEPSPRTASLGKHACP